MGPREVSPNLLYWLDNQLLKPYRILVLDCGNGYEVITLAEKGFEVIAVDIVSTPISNLSTILKDRQITVELIQADFFEWKPEKPFDAIYEQTSLCAIPLDKRMDYEKYLFQWLKLQAQLFAQFMKTEEEGGPPFHCSIATMTNLFDAKRWRWIKDHPTNIIHSKGKYEKNTYWGEFDKYFQY